jgi:integrase
VSVLQPAPIGDKEASDFAWLTSLSTALLKEAARMPKKKEGCRLAAEDILALGLREMDHADLSAGCRRKNLRYRNGLILALWICLPERLRAFAGIRLRDIAADLSWIDFPKERQKTGRAIRRVIPTVLRPYLQRYLERIHSIHTKDHDRLWITERGAAAGPKALYGAVRDVTGRGLGVTLSPHRLRDAAARFVVEEMTSEVRLASVILNHRSEQSTAPYIEGANTLKASREAVALIKQSERQAIRP